jgi:hypothetical protein
VTVRTAKTFSHVGKISKQKELLCKIGAFIFLLAGEIYPNSYCDLHSAMPLSHHQTNQKFGEHQV